MTKKNIKNNSKEVLMKFACKTVLHLVAATMLTGCNYSITMIHTEGQASDVVDETATATPTTSLSIPAPIGI